MAVFDLISGRRIPLRYTKSGKWRFNPLHHALQALPVSEAERNLLKALYVFAMVEDRWPTIQELVQGGHGPLERVQGLIGLLRYKHLLGRRRGSDKLYLLTVPQLEAAARRLEAQ